MKPLVLISLYILNLCMFSCNLDILPEDHIAGEDAIDNVLTAREALHAAYIDYPKNSMTFSILSEDFFPTYLISRNSSLNLLYKWDTQEIETESKQIWNDYYKTITDINVVLLSEKYIKLTTESERNKWNIIKGEAYALKGLAYFELLQIYANADDLNDQGIILKDKVELETLPRSTVHDCYEEINRLLGEASILLSENASIEINPANRINNYIGFYALTLLRARVALYEQNYEQAKYYSEKLINDVGYKNNEVSQSEYRDLWTDQKVNEKLFSFYKQTYHFSEYEDSKTNGDYIAIPSVFKYSEKDVRKDVASFSFIMKANGHLDPINRSLMGKYRTNIGEYTANDINYLRLAEAYFILSECYAELGNTPQAILTINTFLTKRSADHIPSNAIEINSFKERLFLEKQREFHGEGLNYFELKRLNKDIKRYNVDNESVRTTIGKDDYRRQFPIPLSELKNNPNIQQNKGWSNIIH